MIPRNLCAQHAKSLQEIMCAKFVKIKFTQYLVALLAWETKATRRNESASPVKRNQITKIFLLYKLPKIGKIWLSKIRKPQQNVLVGRRTKRVNPRNRSTWVGKDPQFKIGYW